MSKLFDKISISLLLAVSMGIAHANPGQFPEWRDGPRPGRQLRIDEQSDARQREFMQRQQGERRRPGDAIGAPVQGQVRNPPGGNVYNNAAPDAPQRPGRMSPEERRALRRQINEAGRDIYSAPR